MSESAGKIFRGLQEAYASIYADNSENLTEDTIVSEVQEEQEFEINEEALYESAIGYLIHFGYASDEKKAAAMIPHMSEQWMTEFLIHDILAENFVIAVNTLLEEGKDLSGYTWDELYEGYCSNAAENLNEYTDVMPGGGLGNAVLGGILGAGAWGLSNLKKAFSPSQSAFRGYRDYGQSGTSTYKPKPKPVVTKPKPAPVVKSQSVDLDNPSPTPYPRTSTATARVTSGSTATPAPGPGGGGDGGDNGDNKPPKDKGPNWFQRKLEQINKGIQRGQVERDAARAAKETARQASGKPSPTEKITQVATNVLRGALPYGLGVAGGDLLSGGATQGFGQGATSQFMRDVKNLIGQGQKLGPGYTKLKQDVKGAVSPEEEKPKTKPAPVILTPSKYKMPPLPQ